MTSPYPELRTLALIEGAEAVATNLENAVTFEIGRVVGTQDPIYQSLSGPVNCDFMLGDGIINEVLARMMGILCNIFQGVFQQLEEFGRHLADTISGVVGSLIDTIRDGVSGFIDTLTNSISAVVTGLAIKVNEIINTIVDTLGSLIDAITSQVSRIVEGLQDIIGAIFNKISAVVVSLFNKVSDAVATVIDAIGSVLVAIKDLISNIIGTVLDAVWAVITSIGEGIANLIDTVIGTAEAGLGKVRQVIEDIPSTLRELASEAQDFIGEKIGDPLGNIGEVFITQVEAFFGRMIDDLEVSPEKIIREFLTGVGLRAEEVDRIARSADKAMPRTPAIFVIVAGFLAVTLLPPIVSTILQPALLEIQQEVAQRVTPTLIPAGDAMEAFYRGAIDETRLSKEMGEAGYSKERIDTMLIAGTRLMGIGDLLTWWLRDIITEDHLDNLLSMHRVTDSDRENIKQAVFFIPPVQDLIQMAVREVFTPDIRERFELDEGFPAEFQETAKQQGVSEEWAKNYWAAHWVLPSVTQGFTMLHRKVITLDDLDLLLRAQDVMPFWRERITQVAFHPLTRVDLRRMHKLGLLDSEQLQLRYEDLGFDVGNAAMMTQFTEAYNEEEPPEVALELEGLTRGTVLGMFDDGVLTEGETQIALLDLGISEAATSLFISQRKLERERKDRTDQINTIIKLAGGGHVDLDQAQDSLAGLGLTDTEVKLAVQRILRARGSRDRLPTLAQLNKMLQGRIVTPGQWVSAMAGLGYSDVWIDRIGRLVASGETVGE